MKKNKTYFPFIAMLLFGFYLTGCTTTVTSNVTSYHYLAPNCSFIGSVHVKPEANIQPGLEFAFYAQNVYTGLAKYGFQQSISEQSADYIAFLGCYIDSGRIEQHAIPVTQPIYYSPYSSPIYTTTYHNEFYYVYTRTVSIKLIRRSTNEPIWEATNFSYGSNEMSQFIPTMINAMFKDFPGTAGKTRIIRDEIQL